ncbi:MAG: PQQ-dependent sugar dehydrogenase, partial [Euzebyales bacterium]|nr:PQQ-dependent sugar dehydrogenase [Euzebyales bacterium]
LEAPWGLAFLPGGDALVSERDTARILRVTPDGQVSEADRLPMVRPGGEGGLLGLAVSPNYRRDRLVYAYLTAADDNRIVRFRLGAGAGAEAILTGIPKASIHNGGRIAFGPDGMLYAGTGEAGRGDPAQDPDSLGGKILRLTAAGGVPDDNPTGGSPVYSLGHRNVQGLAWDADGRLYASEFGQRRFDELNRIEPGANYGWPQVEGDSGGRFADPLVTWDPAEASPSGMAHADGSLFLAALRGGRLLRVGLDGDGGVIDREDLLVGEYGRLRHAALAPDGSLWLLTSNRDGRGEPGPEDDRILRFALDGG